MESERYKKGAERLKEMGDNSPICCSVSDIAPDLEKYIVEFAFGDIHSRPGLGKREREIAIIAALAALGHAPLVLKAHINMALNVGCTRAEVLEVLIQMAVYAGFPAAVNGVFLAKEVFKQRDAEGRQN